MPRPRGETREAMRLAFEALCAEHGPVTWRAAALHAKVGLDKAYEVTHDMVRAGQLARVGSCKQPHCTRWSGLYELAKPRPAQQWTPVVANAFGLPLSMQP